MTHPAVFRRAKAVASNAPERAFKRAREQFAKIGAAIETTAHLSPLEKSVQMQILLGEMSPYVSRGKGRGTPARRHGNRPGCTWHERVGQPGAREGARECARRARQQGGIG